MATETIKTDEEGNVLGTHNTRNDVLDQIQKQNEEEKLSGGMIDEEGNPVTAFDGPIEKIEKAPDQEQEEEVVLKVDGEEIRKTKSDVEAHGGVRAYQMELAAEKRLEEAKKILNEAKQIQPKPEQPQAPIQTTRQPSDEELIEESRMGSTEAALMADRELNKRYENDPERLQRLRATIQQEVRNTLELDRMIAEFRNSYPEIWESQPLMTAVIQMENQKRQLGDTRPPAILHKEIVDELRAKIASPQTLEDKAARKGNVTNIVSAKTKSQAPEPERQPSPSELIESMKRSRGQVV